MLKNIKEMIKKLEMHLVRKDGELAIGIHPDNAPNKKEVEFIKANREEILQELKAMQNEKWEKERKIKENTPIKVVLEKVDELHEVYIVKQNKEMAEELKIGKQVGYWGVVVDKKVIDVLGTEFTVEEVKAYLAPEREKERKEKKIKKEQLNNLQEQAKVLGHEVEIESYPVECDGSVEECDLDIITRYIDGKGNITTSRMHTH